jgi:hypothetical protein
MLYKEVLQSFVLRTKAEKTAKGISKRRVRRSREPFWPKMLSGRHGLKSW